MWTSFWITSGKIIATWFIIFVILLGWYLIQKWIRKFEDEELEHSVPNILSGIWFNIGSFVGSAIVIVGVIILLIEIWS